MSTIAMAKSSAPPTPAPLALVALVALVAQGVDVDPLGVDGAGRVVLRAVEAVVAAREAGEHRALRADLGGTDLRPGVAGDLARGEPVEPPRLVGTAGVLPQPVLDEGEVAAEGLREVAVDRRELDPQLGHLRQRQPLPAVLARHAHGAEAGRLEPGDLLDRQLAVELAPDGPGRDPLPQRGVGRAQPRQARGVDGDVGHERHGGLPGGGPPHGRPRGGLDGRLDRHGRSSATVMTRFV